MVTVSDQIFESDKHPLAPHPREASEVQGHDVVRKLFLESYHENKLHHAWIINGPQGIGKATIAWNFAKFLLANDQAITKSKEKLNHHLNYRISALTEQSLLLIRREYDHSKKKLNQEISIDQVRKILHFFSLSCTTLNRRLVIIDAIDNLSRPASNALLKILEEPPNDALFLMINHDIDSVIPTVLSRSKLVRCCSLCLSDFQYIIKKIQKAPNSEQDFSKLYYLANGSVSKALDLLSYDGLGIYKEILDILAFDENMNRKRIWELVSQKKSQDSLKNHNQCLEDLLLLALSRIALNSLTKNQHEGHLEESMVLSTFKVNKDTFYPFAKLYSLLAENFRASQEVNTNQADYLFSAFLNIEKVLLPYKAKQNLKN